MGGDSGEVGDSGAAAIAAGDGGTAVNINIRCSTGSKFSVKAGLDSTVESFKRLIAESSEVPVEQQRLIYKGRILKDDQTLQSYGLEANHTIHLVRGAAPSALQNAPNVVSTGDLRTSNTADGDGRGPRSNESGGLGGAGPGGSLFPGLGVPGSGGAPGQFGAGFPGFDQMQQMHQQLTQNPNMMREMLNMPLVQNLMNNPDLLRNLIMSNPQMREVVDRNPELAHILNDPNTLRQTLEATRNPELMREMMRNTDRAMSNIESSPEGFNMLRRMYETVQEPFLNATTMAGESGNATNPLAALLGNQAAAQGRDRSMNLSTTGLETTGSPAPNANPLPNPWGGGQANSTRPSPAGDVGAPGIAGLGGLGLPDMQRGTQDSSIFGQVLQNPAMAQMMQSLLSNPQYINQILNLNPEARSLMENNPQLREMLQNPEFLQQLASPDALRHLFALQQSLTSLGLGQSGQEQNQTGTVGIGLDQLMNMFGGLNAGGLGARNIPDVPPEELYATQLSQLQEMGFFDTQENIRALVAAAGNVHAAVERLLGNTSR